MARDVTLPSALTLFFSGALFPSHAPLTEESRGTPSSLQRQQGGQRCSLLSFAVPCSRGTVVAEHPSSSLTVQHNSFTVFKYQEQYVFRVAGKLQIRFVFHKEADLI